MKSSDSCAAACRIYNVEDNNVVITLCPVKTEDNFIDGMAPMCVVQNQASQLWS